MWKVIFSVVASISITVLLFFVVYASAYLIVKGGMYTFRKIRETVKDKQE